MSSVAPAASSARPKASQAYADRWKHPELLNSGYLVVPSDFLRHYSRLKLTHGEVLFVLHLMSFKWDQAAPFPSYATLARRMGVTTKMARRYAQKLEQKGFLQRHRRGTSTNLFDLTPLFDKLLEVVQANAPDDGKGSREGSSSSTSTSKEGSVKPE